MNITILGAGAYGIALSSMFLENNCNITIWTKLDSEKEMLEKERCNYKVLPDYRISDKIMFTTDLENAITDANIIVIAIPVKFVTSVITELSKFYKNIYVLLVKELNKEVVYLLQILLKNILKLKKYVLFLVVLLQLI